MSFSPEYDEGIRLCTKNCSELLEDAEILLKHGSYGHALSLSILGVEEYPKKIVLLAAKFGCAEDDETFWKKFREHNFKLQMAFYMLFKSKELPEEIIKDRVEFFTRLDPIKQRGLYVDYDKGEWISPFDSDLIELSKQTLDVARQFFSDMEEYFLTFKSYVGRK